MINIRGWSHRQLNSVRQLADLGIYLWAVEILGFTSRLRIRPLPGIQPCSFGVPWSDTEEHLLSRQTSAMSNVCTISSLGVIQKTCSLSLDFENAQVCGYSSLSPLAYGLWPLLILASRHPGIRVSPNFWPFYNAQEHPGCQSAHMRL